MDCKELAGQAALYQDGELGAAEAAAIEAHAAQCPDCRKRLEAARALSSGVRRLGNYYHAAAGLASRVSQRLAAESSRQTQITHEPEPLLSPARRAAWLWRPFASGTAFGGVIAFTLALLLFFPSKSSRIEDQLVASHIRSLMGDHLTDVLSSDQHTVKPWFNGKLDYSPPVKDLAADGYPLIGGRLDYIDGQPVSALVYKRRKHVINVYIWPASGPDLPTRKMEKRGFTTYHWSDDGLSYWIVSDLNTQEFEEFCKKLRQTA